MKVTVGLILIVLCLGCNQIEQQKTGLEGQKLPQFKFLLADSVTWVSSDNIPRGKPIVLLYFSPNCPYCMAETREIVNNVKKLQNVKIFMITNFPFREMKAFYNKFHLSKYDNISAGVDTSGILEKYFNIAIVPFTAIYSRDKILLQSYVGIMNTRQLVDVGRL